MFRYRVRPPTPLLDEAAAERLLSGAPIDDLPDTFQPLGELLAAASGPPTPDELDGSAAAAAAFVAAHHAANRTLPRTRRSLPASVLTALVVVSSTGTAVAATQGALPEPVQQVAHEALGVVGIHVPGMAKGDDAGNGDGRHGDAGNDVSVRTPPSTTSGPKVTTGDAPSDAVVPSAAGTGASTTTETGAESASGTGNAPTTPPGQENTIDRGSSGQDQGNASAGSGSSGQGAGTGNGGSTPSPGDGPGNRDGTGSNLPDQSHGNGNGPPQVPPGQAKRNP